jgi:prepilin-type N-terminal cleavage/methylation domain-containing protein
MTCKRQNGFTLIEILIVVAIIGILTGLVTVNLQSARERARDIQRKSDLKNIQNGLEMYKNDQRYPRYPADADWKDSENGIADYMKGGVPEDPTHKSNPTGWSDYAFTLGATNLQYTLVACLENSGDQDKDAANTCTTGYSYTLTQP